MNEAIPKQLLPYLFPAVRFNSKRHPRTSRVLAAIIFSLFYARLRLSAGNDDNSHSPQRQEVIAGAPYNGRVTKVAYELSRDCMIVSADRGYQNSRKVTDYSPTKHSQ